MSAIDKKIYLRTKIKAGAVLLSFIFTVNSVCLASPDKDVYRVKNVIDGDTLELVNSNKVRYIGIDTPETMKRVSGEWVYSPEPYAAKAKQFNRDLVGRDTVRLEYDTDKKDRYGRILAYVHASGGKMVNEELIKNGLATVYTFYPNTRYVDSFIALQDEAIALKKGMWRGLKTISTGEARDNVGKMRIVTGRAARSYKDRSYLILEFTAKRQSRFTAEIPVSNIPLFEARGEDPFKDYLGKDLALTGKIKKGPSMYIDNPSQIKILPKK